MRRKAWKEIIVANEQAPTLMLSVSQKQTNNQIGKIELLNSYGTLWKNLFALDWLPPSASQEHFNPYHPLTALL